MTLAVASPAGLTTQDAVVNLDVSGLAFDEHGVQDFFWPVARRELVAVREAVQAEIPRIAARTADRDPDSTRFLSAFGHLLAREAITLFQVAAILNRTLCNGISVAPPARSRFIRPLLAGEPPSFSWIMSFLVRGYPPRPRWMAPARLARDLWLTRDGLSRRYFTKPNYRRGIYACGTSRLITRHARQIDEKVTYARLDGWFGPLDPRELEATRRRTARWPIMGDILDCCARIFGQQNVPLQGPTAQYLERWLTEAASITQLRLERLFDRRDDLPNRLWTGTGGQPFVRLLRLAVRAAGGHVTGHDHAYGTAMWKHHAKTVNDFEECDRFVTFSPQQVVGLMATARRDHLIQRELPEIVSLVDSEHAPRRTLAIPRSGPVRRVMYVMDVYYGEENLLFPFLADPVAVDWQARLLGKLVGWGYDVALKPHPESRFAPPRRFADIVGRPPLTGRFETYLTDFDAILFDNPFTTTFGQALASDRAVVFVDFGITEVRDEVREMLSRRCRVVRGWLDAENRAHVNWDDLACGIEESRDLVDPELSQTFLTGID